MHAVRQASFDRTTSKLDDTQSGTKVPTILGLNYREAKLKDLASKKHSYEQLQQNYAA